ncbi:MAG: transcriptional repressor [Blautia sp.]|nr:transcriptional repressor [Blautia sp.]
MGNRNTIQRQLVLTAVRSLSCHATADQVYNEVCKEHPTISRATVYRNLELLAEFGEIRKVETVSGPALYDHITENHYHIRCRNCGRYFDMDMDIVEGLEKRIRNLHGFEIDGYDIVFSGICPECNED